MDPGLSRALEHCLREGLTFVAFRWRDDVHLWVQLDPAEEHHTTSTLDRITDRFLIAPFVQSADGCIALRPDIRLTAPLDEQALIALQGCTGAQAAIEDPSLPWSEAGHAAAIRAAKNEFASNDLSKVVLSRTLEVACPPRSLPALFQWALNERPDAFVCLAHTPTYGTWLGTSPERLVEAVGKMVTVDSLAGTLPFSDAPRTAANWGNKEREEQDIVTQSILHTFRSLGIKDVSVHGPDVHDAGQVSHLRSTLTGSSDGMSMIDLAFALHPTPAVCGTPREEAARFIAAHEPHDRSLYAGFWGPWRVHDRTSLYVNIRCFRSLPHSAVLYVGGGITAESNEQQEWEETEHKALTWSVPIRSITAGIP